MHYIFWDLLNNLNLTLILKRGEYGELLIMTANGRWDLIQHLKFKHITQCLSHGLKHMKLPFCDVFQCCLQSSSVFVISLNLHPFNHISIFENQNRPWRLGWRSTEARYHHHLILIRHRKKPWIHVAWCVVMIQQPASPV